MVIFYARKRGEKKLANETQIGKLVIDLQIKTQALEAGLNTAKERLKELENSNKDVINSNKELDASFVAVAATATAALLGVKSIISSSIDEYNQYTQAMSGLKDVADYTGQSMDEFGDIMKDFNKYMTKSDIAATIKNFSLMGMSAKQTRQMMESLTNSAIKNRNANYTVSEAVKVASDGYKQGLSTLSDSAGVTENLSVMLDKYAQSIGKTASQLTEQEINQAYVNRTMEAAAPFAQAMTEYNETLAGKQGDLNNALKETQVAYATAIEPTYSAILAQITNITTAVGTFISEHQELVAGSTAFVVTLGVLGIAVLAVKKAYDAYTKSAFAATVAQEGFNAAIMANPVGLAVGLVATAVAGFAGLEAALETNRAKQEEVTKAQAEYNKVVNGTIELNQANVSSMREAKQTIEEYQKVGEQWTKDRVNLWDYQDMLNGTGQTIEVLKELGLTLEDVGLTEDEIKAKIAELRIAVHSEYDEYKKLDDKIKELLGIQKEELLNYKEVEQALKAYTKRIEEAESIEKIKSATDIEAVKTQQKEAAQLKVNVQEMQNYLDVIKLGHTSTAEYQNALNALAKAYPEAANAEGIMIDQAQAFIDAEALKADQAWNASQTTIQGNIAAVQTFIDLANAAANDADMQAQLAQAIGIDYAQIIPTLTSVLNILQQIGGQTPTQVPRSSSNSFIKTKNI